jgi:hypothetical protein
MNKFMKGMLAALMVTSLAACSSNKPAEDASDTGAEMPENPVLIIVNTEGVGNIAMAAEGEEIVWDENFPTTSIGQNVEKGTKHTLAAKAGEDYKFIKWTKDGADFSTDETTVITADEKAEYVAVFMYDNGWDGEAVTDINDATVIGDVLGLPSLGNGTMEDVYMIAVELNGNTYRVSAALTPEQSEALWVLDFDDPDYNAKQNELLKDLPITNIENLTENAPKAEDLAKYEGVKGSDLTAEGWMCNGYNLEEMSLDMTKGPYAFTVFFQGEVNSDVDDMDEAIKDVTVLHIENNGIGDVLGQ